MLKKQIRSSSKCPISIQMNEKKLPSDESEFTEVGPDSKRKGEGSSKKGSKGLASLFAAEEVEESERSKTNSLPSSHNLEGPRNFASKTVSVLDSLVLLLLLDVSWLSSTSLQIRVHTPINSSYS